MRISAILIIFAFNSLLAIAPHNPYKDITYNKWWAMELRKEIKHKRILNLMTSIRIVESNEKYNIIGGSGEYGAYQFMPKTWEEYCNELIGRVIPIYVPHNQDYIAYLKVKKFVDAGHSNEEIAVYWNAGRFVGDWQNMRGWNKFNQYYDVPAYVQKIINTYKILEIS